MVQGGGEKIRRAIAGVICATAIALVMVQAPMVVLAEPVTVTGTMSQETAETVWMRTAGGNTFILAHNTWSVSGDLQGTLDSQPRVMILATGEIKVTEWAMFTGTWGDYEGTLKIRNIGGMVGPGLFHLDSTIVGGTGDLAKVRGYGSVDVNSPEKTATYSFDLYWEVDA